jgi:hypothetical protein
VLQELGYSDRDIALMAADGVVRLGEALSPQEDD